MIPKNSSKCFFKGWRNQYNCKSTTDRLNLLRTKFKDDLDFCFRSKAASSKGDDAAAADVAAVAGAVAASVAKGLVKSMLWWWMECLS